MQKPTQTKINTPHSPPHAGTSAPGLYSLQAEDGGQPGAASLQMQTAGVSRERVCLWEAGVIVYDIK